MPAPTSNRAVLVPWKVQTAVGQGQQLFLDLLRRSGGLKRQVLFLCTPQDPSGELKSPVSGHFYLRPCSGSVPGQTIPYHSTPEKVNPLTAWPIPFYVNIAVPSCLKPKLSF